MSDSNSTLDDEVDDWDDQPSSGDDDHGIAAEEWASATWPPGLLREIAVESFMAGAKWRRDVISAH